VRGEVDALNKGKPEQACQYFQPSFQAECRQEVTGPSAGHAPTFKNFHLGYVAIDHKEALVGTTGTLCSPNTGTQCTSNNNPAAIFSTGKPFETLWAETMQSNTDSSSTAYSLVSCIEVGKSWYVYIPTGT
jgi:hypothetical protein